MSSRTQLLAAAIATAIFTAALIHAGPLTPPAGPVASTYKTLAEIEPATALSSANTPGDSANIFIITQPGSYYLTADLVAAGKSGIKINVPGVSVDLHGFTMDGGYSGGTANTGVLSLGQCTIHNGTIRNFAFGVQGNATGSVAERLTIVNPASVGILLNTANVRIEDCTIDSGSVPNASGPVGVLLGANGTICRCKVRGGSGGYTTGGACIVKDSTAAEISGDGFHVGPGSRVADCSSDSAGGTGFVGDADGCSFAGCSAMGGATNSTGFSPGFGSHCRDCTADGAGGDGFSLADNSTIERCVAQACGVGGDNHYGIRGGPNTIVQECTVSFCAGGILLAGDNGSVIQCVVGDNNDASGTPTTTSGITVQSGSIVSGCTVRNSPDNGIKAFNQSTITNNTCTGNGANTATTGGCGILITGASGRVDGNLCDNNRLNGIRLSGNFNMLLRNACRLNGAGNPANNYSLGVGNDFGPIVTVTNASSSTGVGDISGTTGSSNPWANFSF